MSNWSKTTLGQIASIITGPFGTELHKADYRNIGIAVIMPQNIDDRSINHAKIAYVSDDTAKRLERYAVKQSDLVFSRRGDVEKHAYITNQSAGYLCGTGCFRVTPDTLLIDPEFLSWFLNSPTTRSWLKKNAVGSNMPNLNTGILSSVRVAFPERDEQVKISRILSVLDQKIQNNKKIIAELEAMAQTLYDYWFVQFDFPDAQGKPYKSSGGKMVYNPQLKREIPDGWEVKHIKDLANISTGKEDANFASHDGEYKFFTCSHSVSKCKSYVYNGHAILIAGNGDFNAKHYSGKFNAYQRTYVLIPHSTIHYALSYISAKLSLSRLKKTSCGSIVKFITRADIENINVILPHDTTFLSTLNQSIFNIEKLADENESLTTLRDYLLPMLMNGQVSII